MVSDIFEHTRTYYLMNLVRVFLCLCIKSNNTMYKTAKEFGDAIKKSRFQYEAEPEDLHVRQEAIRKIYGQEIDQKLAKQYSETETKFSEVIGLIVEELMEVIPVDIRSQFKDHFYFSTADTRKLNASIIRSQDGNYFSVIINSSLINLLTKLGKLEIAFANPGCVKFCNRNPERKPTKEELGSMKQEMYDYFTNFKMSHGPFLIIDGLEAAFHFDRLNIQEKLIVFHEIGHFICGDLFKTKNEQVLVESDNIKNIHYQREFLADIIGFGLLLRLEKLDKEISLERRLHILNALVFLFEVLSRIQVNETDKYPHPLNRMNTIIEYYYGIEFAEIIEKMFKGLPGGNWDYLRPNTCPKIDSKEDQLDQSINSMLYRAFDKQNW